MHPRERMKNSVRKIGTAIIILGCLCLVAAAAVTLYNMYDDARAASSMQDENRKLEEYVLAPGKAKDPRGNKYADPMDRLATPAPAEPDQTRSPEDSPEPVTCDMPVVNIDGTDYVAMLGIPSLGLEFAVRSEWSYAGLKNSPCRYMGSAYTRDLIICAHNYSTHFGRLNELVPGDEVLLVDMDGVLFTYTVELIEELGRYDFGPMQESGYDLTLFTCTVGGRKRVTVRLSLVSVTVPKS